MLRDVDLALPEGLVGILGELRNAPAALDSNGSGKSTLVNALVACLFGPSGRSFADDLTRGEDRMEIELTFEQGGETYRVRRTFTLKGGAKLDFEQIATDHDPGERDQWEPLTRESLTATQELVDRTIGLSRSTFLRSVFLSQEDGSFADGAAKEAKTLLAEAAFGPDPSWSRYAARAGDERKRFEVELQQLEGRTQAARTLVATKPELEREHEAAIEAETVAADTLADREREHAGLAARWQAAREQDATRKACEAEVREASSAYNALAARGTAADDAARQIVAANERLTSLGITPDIEELERRVTELGSAVDAYNSAASQHELAFAQMRSADRERVDLDNRACDLLRKSEGLRFEADMLDARPLDDGATCTHCGQVLGVEARETALAKYRSDADALDVEAKALREQMAAVVIPTVPPAPEGTPPHAELAAARTDLTAAMQARTERAQLAERIDVLTPAASAGPSPADLSAAYALVQAKQAILDSLVPVDLPGLEQEGLWAKSKVDTAKTTLDRCRATLARLDERRVQMVAAEQALADAAVRTADLQSAIDARVRLEKACGLNGVPALILETSVIPFIETETARVLADLGTPFQVELRTQREKQDGGMADTLEVVIVTDTGESPYRKLSGGEKMRVNVALRVALGRLLAGRSGARSRLLVIDEPRWLDQAGIEALIESLRGLLGEFSRIYVVTQSGTALRDSFDQVLTVIKDGGASRVEDGYAVEAEAVPA